MRVSALSRRAAVAAAGIALVGAGVLPAMASPHHAAVTTKTFKSTLTPTSGVKTGTKLHLSTTKAEKNTTYDCILTVEKGADTSPDIPSIVETKSNSKGHASCTLTFKKFTATSFSNGKKHSCPLTKADKKAGYKCAVAMATTTKTSASINYFTTK